MVLIPPQLIPKILEVQLAKQQFTTDIKIWGQYVNLEYVKHQYKPIESWLIRYVKWTQFDLKPCTFGYESVKKRESINSNQLKESLRRSQSYSFC